MFVHFKNKYLLVILAFFISSLLFSQQNSSDNSSLNANAVKVVSLESWDNIQKEAPYGWRVVGDKETKVIGLDGEVNYENKEYKPKLEDIKISPEFTREVKLVNGASSSLRLKNRKDSKILGVKFAFLYPGYNSVVIEPPKINAFKLNRREHLLDQSQAKENFVYGVEVPGTVKKFSVWVLGRGFDYNLEGIVEDYKGAYHVVKFGSIKFIGWKNLIASVPLSVKQDSNIYPSNRNLIFKKMILRSKPESQTGPVYVFFDELKALVVPYEKYFDGSDIHFDQKDCEEKNRNSEYKTSCLSLGDNAEKNNNATEPNKNQETAPPAAE